MKVQSITYISLLILLNIFFIFFLDLKLYFNQYDLFGNLLDIAKFKNNFELSLIGVLSFIFKDLEDLYIYKFYIILISIINNTVLFWFILKKYKNNHISFLICLLFSNFLFYKLHSSYGHFTLLFLFFFPIGCYSLNKFILTNRIKFLIFFTLNIFFSYYTHFQIGIYVITLSFAYIFIFNEFEIFKKISFKNIFLIIIAIILSTAAYYFINIAQINELRVSNRFQYEISYINKYSIINPLEIFFNFNFIYEHIINLLNNQYINSKSILYEKYLLYYSPNGPEFTHFYGIVILFLILINFKNNLKVILKSSLIIFLITLFILNNFYFFSLINLHIFILPMIRAVGRAYIIVDFIILFLIAEILKNNKNKFFNNFIILLVVLNINLFNPFKGIKYSINDIYFDASIDRIKYCEQNISDEKKFIYNYINFKNGIEYDFLSSYCITDIYNKNQYGKLFYSNNIIKIFNKQG